MECTAGSYCGTNGLSYPTGLCTAGYYCSGGSSTPIQNDCPLGSYCPAGSQGPISCPDGQYQDTIRADSCKTCPRGHYCFSGSSTPTDCPIKYFCPQGSTANINFCPDGTYGNSSGLSAASDCATCPAGKYCTGGEIQGVIAAGAFCNGGCAYADVRPSDSSFSASLYPDPCEKGRYCVAGTTEQTACPDQYYRNAVAPRALLGTVVLMAP